MRVVSLYSIPLPLKIQQLDTVVGKHELWPQDNYKLRTKTYIVGVQRHQGKVEMDLGSSCLQPNNIKILFNFLIKPLINRYISASIKNKIGERVNSQICLFLWALLNYCLQAHFHVCHVSTSSWPHFFQPKFFTSNTNIN